MICNQPCNISRNFSTALSCQIQKFISFWNADGESTECYNDVRRLKSLGEDIYGLQNPGKFPLRCPYGNDDTTTNPNIQAAYGDGQYVFTENVWWAGGTR